MLASSCRLIGGIVLFFVGIRLIRFGLGGAGRRRVERALCGVARTPGMAVLAGAAITALVQSSSAVTVAVVGLVDAGVLDLYGAFGVIMGANLGTCAQAYLVALRGEAIVLPAVCAGLAGYLLGRKRVHRDAGLALTGFGCVVWAAGVIGSALTWLAREPWFLETLVVLGQVPVLGMAAGAALTGVIQSSGLTTAALIGLARQGLMGLAAAVAAALGSNVGTCATALIASLGASPGARRAALLHLAFNVAGVIAVIPVFPAFVWLVEAVSPLDPGRAIANAHTLFNLLSIAVVLPWSRKFVDLVRGGRPWMS